MAIQLRKLRIDVPTIILFDSYPLFGEPNYDAYSTPLIKMITALMAQMRESTAIISEDYHAIRDLFGLSTNMSKDDDVTLELLTSALRRITHMREYIPEPYSDNVYQFKSSQHNPAFGVPGTSDKVIQPWTNYIQERYITELVDGTHFAMVQEPALRPLLPS